MKVNKVITMDADLINKIDEIRKKENRSFSNMMVTIVKKYLAGNGTK